MLAELTIFHGVRINTFPYIVEAAGLKELLVPSLIESTLQETEPGLILHFHLKLSSTVRLVEAATEETLEESTPSLKRTEFLRKAARTISPKILINFLALPFKNVRTALILKDRSPGIKATAGQPLVIQYGK